MKSETVESLQGSYLPFGGSILRFLLWEERIAAANLDCMVVAVVRFGASKREHSINHFSLCLQLSLTKPFYPRVICLW